MRSPHGAKQWLKSRSWFYPVTKVLFGNTVYSKSYYDSVEQIEKESVLSMGDWIARVMKPASVIDVGCGPGHMMKALADRGVKVFGVDISDAALAKVEEKGLEATRFDLTAPGTNLPGVPYDLAISCEVAEHLEEQHAMTFLEKLTNAAPKVFLTAAEPHSAESGVGLYHVNEQPNVYWIERMKRLGYELSDETEAARKEFAEKKVTWYLASPMIFKKRAG